MSKKVNYTDVIDYYEFSMSNVYYEPESREKYVYFDIFFRKNPFKGEYTVSGGLDEVIDYIKNFKLTRKNIKKLEGKGINDKKFLRYLKKLKFNGDIYAVPDGTVVFPNEPVITIKAKVIEAQLIETALLACMNHGTLITTAARRLYESSNRTSISEFGTRRGAGLEVSPSTSKYAYIGGFSSTSNFKSYCEDDIPISGTMAHSLVQFYEDEEIAFKKFAEKNPDNCVFLVDTYDVLESGIPNAIKVAKEYLVPNGIEFKGIRIDSGDIPELTKQIRKMLDDAGFTNTKICISNGINEKRLNNYNERKAIYDNIGLGDNVAYPLDLVGFVDKLAAVEENGKIVPRIKVSEDAIKTTNPGYKKVYRFYDKETGKALGDVITLADEIIPDNKYTLVKCSDNSKMTITNYNVKELQSTIFKYGKQVYDRVSPKESRTYCEKEIDTIPSEVIRSINPCQYNVGLSEQLYELKNDMINQKTKKRVRRLGD